MAFFDRINIPVPQVNQGSQNGPAIQTWLRFENDLIAQGWRVLGSGDTFTFENAGQTAGTAGTGPGGGFDLITSADGGVQQGADTRVVGGRGNIWGFPYASDLAGSSWRRIATPVDAQHYREYLFTIRWRWNQTTSRNHLCVYMARDAAAFSDNATPVAPPLPNDKTRYVALVGRQNMEATGLVGNQEPEHLPFFPGTDSYAHWFIGDASEDYDFLFWSTRSSEKSIFRFFGQLRLVNTYAESIGKVDTDPYLYVSSGGHTTSSSTDVGRNSNYCFVPETAVPARLEDRLTIAQQHPNGGSNIGFGYASWGRWDTNPDPEQGTYGVSLWPQGALSTDLNTSTPDGKSLVIFNPLVGRATSTGAGTEFYKGQIKSKLIGLSTRFDDPTVMEDEVGPDGASTGRRLSVGHLHLLWKDHTIYQE